jgi:hypothetical protein
MLKGADIVIYCASNLIMQLILTNSRDLCKE